MLTDREAGVLRDRLYRELTKRRKRITMLENYREGRHPLPQGITHGTGGRTAEMRRVFEQLLKESRSNWCGMVVDAVDERLAVDGFRFGGEQESAADVWTIWQANHLDAESLLVQGCALSTGQAYVTVWPGERPGDFPVITPEHPCEVIVAYAPGTRRTRRAALKVWADDDGYLNANLYEPDVLWKWRSARSSTGFSGQFWAGDRVQWVPRELEDEAWPLANLLGSVPVVEFSANPRLAPSPYGGGVAEFEEALDIQDRINETVFGRLLAMHFSAFRQKWATGLEVPKDEQGKAVEPYKTAVQKLWTAKNKDVRFGEFAEHNLKNYLESAEADVQHLAAITKTPPHYLLGKMANLSGDALKAAETGLVSKVGRHQRFFGESWEEVARLGVAAQDPTDARALDVRAEVIWRDTESRSEAERVDALVKLSTIGVPREVLWGRIPGVTQTEVERWKAMAAEEAATAALAAITTAVPQEEAPAPEPVG